MVRTRKAILPDVERIHAIIRPYAEVGTLLPRTISELSENVRDFVVVEDDGKIIGCGALHLYGMHLAEIRTIAVVPAIAIFVIFQRQFVSGLATRALTG